MRHPQKATTDHCLTNAVCGLFYFRIKLLTISLYRKASVTVMSGSRECAARFLSIRSSCKIRSLPLEESVAQLLIQVGNRRQSPSACWCGLIHEARVHCALDRMLKAEPSLRNNVWGGKRANSVKSSSCFVSFTSVIAFVCRRKFVLNVVNTCAKVSSTQLL